MARILGSMVARNERDRYLVKVIEWHLEFLDGIHLYDDQSDDGTGEMAARAGAVVDVRPDDERPFLEHEGDFRQAAWESFELDMQPLPGDWVLSIDADEFFCAPEGDERHALERLQAFARSQDANAARIRIDEIFDFVDEVPQRRIDGYWSTIAAPRLFRYQAGGRFANRRMGCGSTPTFVNPVNADMLPYSILHYGYAHSDDRLEKHRRYTSMRNNGHNSRHIDSIVKAATLEAIPSTRWPEL
jgi:hypothetical protein